MYAPFIKNNNTPNVTDKIPVQPCRNYRYECLPRDQVPHKTIGNETLSILTLKKHRLVSELTKINIVDIVWHT